MLFNFHEQVTRADSKLKLHVSIYKSLSEMCLFTIYQVFHSFNLYNYSRITKRFGLILAAN